ncbi:MAG: hypothetical protein KF868_08655 [Acidobacteria bacterium]|nr:hypothetical protein [Acidobacteriota bacterium]MCW5968080.1 hypothetical protein [Blastocatellales bacterium]
MSEANNEAQSELRRAYRRASIGLAIAAAVWTAAYFAARERGWSELTILIPIGAAALSVLCYRRYRTMDGGAGNSE